MKYSEKKSHALQNIKMAWFFQKTWASWFPHVLWTVFLLGKPRQGTKKICPQRILLVTRATYSSSRDGHCLQHHNSRLGFLGVAAAKAIAESSNLNQLPKPRNSDCLKKYPKAKPGPIDFLIVLQ